MVSNPLESTIKHSELQLKQKATDTTLQNQQASDPTTTLAYLQTRGLQVCHHGCGLRVPCATGPAAPKGILLVLRCGHSSISPAPGRTVPVITSSVQIATAIAAIRVTDDCQEYLWQTCNSYCTDHLS